MKRIDRRSQDATLIPMIVLNIKIFIYIHCVTFLPIPSNLIKLIEYDRFYRNQSIHERGDNTEQNSFQQNLAQFLFFKL